MRTEFDLINDFKKKYSLRSVGDDCAVLPKNAEFDMLITADMLVEDIDFRLKWAVPEYLGHKTLAVSLSDIAAMGGKPVWAMLSIAVPESLWQGNFLDRFYDGWHKLAEKFSVELIGGDISRSPDRFVIDSIVVGEVKKGNAILRSTAKPGDLIYVSGSLGGAAGGLDILENGRSTENESLILNQLSPEPQCELALQLAEQQIPTAMIDLSDGLSADLAHICSASGVGARIFADKIPVNKDLADADSSLEFALNGGEDLQLLFTTDISNQAALNIFDVTCIGEITNKAGLIELIDQIGTKILKPKGFRHF